MDNQELFKWRKIRAEDLKNKRLQAKLSVAKLAELSGVDRKTIFRIEKGEISWMIDTEILLLSILRYNKKGIDELLSKNGSPVK